MKKNGMLEEIHNDVEQIKKQLAGLRALLVERMSEEDIVDFEQAMREHEQGKTTRLSDLRW